MVVPRGHAKMVKYMLHTSIEMLKCFGRQGNLCSNGISGRSRRKHDRMVVGRSDRITSMVVSRGHSEKLKYILRTSLETSECFCRQGNCYSDGISDGKYSKKWRFGHKFETL
jgi:hypothetical protein